MFLAGQGLLGSDTHFAAALRAAPYGRALGTANWSSDPKNPALSSTNTGMLEVPCGTDTKLRQQSKNGSISAASRCG